MAQAVAPPVSLNDAGACGFSGPKAPGVLPPKSSASLPGPIMPPVKPVSSTPPKPVVGATAHVPASAPVPASTTVPSSSNVTYEDDPCVICHDEMTRTTKNVSLDCGHTFHHDVSII